MTDRAFASILASALATDGYFVIDSIVPCRECDALRALYDTARFRQTVRMTRDDYGKGEYKYFDYPLPSAVQRLREDWYSLLVASARAWTGDPAGIPETLEEYVAICRDHGQTDATPLLLTYPPGGMNAMHQDKYGAVAFPLQVMIMLSEPGNDFTGGAFVLQEQHDGNISTVELHPTKGAAVVFPNQYKPGPDGTRTPVRHGVAPVDTGHRMTLGLIFHDARPRRR